MNLVKLEKKTGDKIEQIGIFIKIYLLLKGDKITKSEEIILSYFCHYGINLNTEQLLYKCDIITSKLTYRNAVSKFKALKYIDKDMKRRYYVSDPILSSIEDKMALLIKLDNT